VEKADRFPRRSAEIDSLTWCRSVETMVKELGKTVKGKEKVGVVAWIEACSRVEETV
jgi:hypothetical protein